MGLSYIMRLLYCFLFFLDPSAAAAAYTAWKPSAPCFKTTAKQLACFDKSATAPSLSLSSTLIRKKNWSYNSHCAPRCISWSQSKLRAKKRTNASSSSSSISPSSTSLYNSPGSSFVLLDSTAAMASLSATLKLLFSIGLGGWAARKRIQNGSSSENGSSTTILDPQAISSLSRLTFWIFQPAFLFSSVIKTFGMAAATAAADKTSSLSSSSSSLSLAQLAVVSLAAMFQIGIGAVVGNWLTALPQRRKNSNEAGVNIETAIQDRQSNSIVRMCVTFANSGPLPLIFADALFSRSAPAIQTQVVACISFYILGWSPLFWTFGRLMLGTTSISDNSTTRVIGKSRSSLRLRLMEQIQVFLSPPVVGMIFGILIGGNAFLRNLFLRGMAYPLYSAVQTLGIAYLPAALLVLAGSFAAGPTNGNSRPTSSSSTTTTIRGMPGNNATTVDTNDSVISPSSSSSSSTMNDNAISIRSIGKIAMARFLLAPCWSWAYVYGLNRFNLLGAVGSQSRAILSFVILMEGCMPPAQNSVVILQLVGLTGAATNMARTLTIVYGLAIVPVTLLLSACLSISGIGQFL